VSRNVSHDVGLERTSTPLPRGVCSFDGAVMSEEWFAAAVVVIVGSGVEAVALRYQCAVELFAIDDAADLRSLDPLPFATRDPAADDAGVIQGGWPSDRCVRRKTPGLVSDIDSVADVPAECAACLCDLQHKCPCRSSGLGAGAVSRGVTGPRLAVWLLWRSRSRLLLSCVVARRPRRRAFRSTWIAGVTRERR